jgi:ABC-2 type transport system permease protein
MRRILFVAEKELHHIFRDPRSLTVALVMPIMMTFLYGYAVNMDIENIALAIVDRDGSAESRALSDRFYQSTYFTPPDQIVDPNDPDGILREGAANAVLTIPGGFGESVVRREPVALGLIIDGSDNSLGTAVKAYADAVVNKYLLSTMPVGFRPPAVDLSIQVLYNPDLKSSHFFVPGLVAIILMMISALLTSITIAREKETGTMEQLLVAPVRPLEILAGKILPYIFLALLDGILVLVFAKFLFGVPFTGSKLLLLGFGLIYIITSLAIGILISSLVRTQQLAMMMALMTTMLPSVMLSGYIFAIKNMPPFLQVVSRIVPAQYFLKIIRGIMLKGAAFEVLITQALFLVALAVVMIVVAIKKFNTRIV